MKIPDGYTVLKNYQGVYMGAGGLLEGMTKKGSEYRQKLSRLGVGERYQAIMVMVMAPYPSGSTTLFGVSEYVFPLIISNEAVKILERNLPVQQNGKRLGEI